MSDKSRGTMMPIFLDIGTAISKLHSFFRSVMPVCKVVTNLKFNYRREM